MVWSQVAPHHPTSQVQTCWSVPSATQDVECDPQGEPTQARAASTAMLGLLPPRYLVGDTCTDSSHHFPAQPAPSGLSGQTPPLPSDWRTSVFSQSVARSLEPTLQSEYPLGW